MNDSGQSASFPMNEPDFLTLLFRRLAEKVKTPMLGLQGMIDLMKKASPSAEMKEYLNITEAYNLELVTIISDCLDYVQLRSGDFQLVPDWVNVEDFVNEIDGLMRLKASAKNIEFQCKIGEQARKWIYTDPDRLRQLLVNLLDNALKATRTGKIELNIENLGILDDQMILAFTVIDTGQGFDQNSAEQILLAMAQDDSTPLLKIPGVGVGMLIIKEISRHMHGEISFETFPEKGTTVWFTASFKYSNQPVHVSNAAPLAESLRILLVEDNFLNQKFTKTALTKAGHNVDIAENGKVAVEKFTANSYDVILMDVQLPIMDGIEATRQIRTIEKQRGTHTPIIAVTAYALDRDKTRCLEAGMDLFLPKPFKPPQLFALIERAMEFKKA